MGKLTVPAIWFLGIWVVLVVLWSALGHLSVGLYAGIFPVLYAVETRDAEGRAIALVAICAVIVCAFARVRRRRLGWLGKVLIPSILLYYFIGFFIVVAHA